MLRQLWCPTRNFLASRPALLEIVKNDSHWIKRVPLNLNHQHIINCACAFWRLPVACESTFCCTRKRRSVGGIMHVRALKRCNRRKLCYWWSFTFSMLCFTPIGYSSPSDPTCRRPCENVDCGPQPESCPYGNFTRCEGCCIACARGPAGDDCDPNNPLLGPCGDGMECVLERFPGFEIGTCEWLPTPQPPNGKPVVYLSASRG